jgi:threonine dehydrogenase-like Zn-dependent dehydrogenase
MKTLQIIEPGKVEWRETPIPEPGPGEILVRIEGVTTCPHWDLHLMSGEPMFPGRPLPYPYPLGQPGHEAVGVVAALGPGVEGPPPGTRVAAWRDQGHTRPGCYAQYNVFIAEHLLEIPETLPLEAIAPLELAMCVQVSFDQLGELNAVAGQRVGVAGLGPAGLIALQMARSYGARQVVAIDPIASRRQLARELGADQAIAPDELAAFAAEEPLHAAIDCTGLRPSVTALLTSTRKVVALFGVLREPVEFGFRHWASGITLMGYARHNRDAARRALRLVVEGKLLLAPLVTRSLPMQNYLEGVELLRRKEAIKVAFLPWAD